MLNVSSIDHYANSHIDNFSKREENSYQFLLTTAEPQIDSLQHPRDWVLSQRGQAQAATLKENKQLQSVTVIYSSPETTAIQTALPLSRYLGLDIIEVDGLHEAHLDRHYETEEEYNLMIEAKFLDFNLEIGERFSDALNRIISTINGINFQCRKDVGLIISHQTVLSLYHSYQVGVDQTNLFRFWHRMGFCHLQRI